MTRLLVVSALVVGCKGDDSSATAPAPAGKSEEAGETAANATANGTAASAAEKRAKRGIVKRWSVEVDGVDIEPLSGPTIIAGPFGSALSIKLIGSLAIVDVHIASFEHGSAGTFTPTSFVVQIPESYTCSFVKDRDKALTMKVTISDSTSKSIEGRLEGEMSCKDLKKPDEPRKTAKVVATFKK